MYSKNKILLSPCLATLNYLSMPQVWVKSMKPTFTPLTKLLKPFVNLYDGFCAACYALLLSAVIILNILIGIQGPTVHDLIRNGLPWTKCHAPRILPT